MSDILLWFIAVELTAGLCWISYTLYLIQTELAVVVLHAVAVSETPPATITYTVAQPEILESVVVDDTDTVGTFTGQPWK